MPRNPALTTQQERVARQTPARRNVTNADRPAALILRRVDRWLRVVAERRFGPMTEWRWVKRWLA